jgi:hypothetical protein
MQPFVYFTKRFENEIGNKREGEGERGTLTPASSHRFPTHNIPHPDTQQQPPIQYTREEREGEREQIREREGKRDREREMRKTVGGTQGEGDEKSRESQAFLRNSLH